MSQFEIRVVPRQQTAVVVVTTPTGRISEAMGQAFGAVFAALGRLDVAPAGPALCKYTAYSEESVTFEAGVSVAEPFAGDGDVVGSEIGGVEAAVAVHVGPYDTLSHTYGALQSWIESQGRQPGVVMWELYLNDPDTTPPDQLQTEIYWPVEEAS